MTAITEAMWDDLLNQRDIQGQSKTTQIKANRNKMDQRYQRLLTNQHLRASHLRNAICAILPLSQQSASAVAFNAQNARADMWRLSNFPKSRSPCWIPSILKCFTLHIRDFSIAVTAFSTRSAAPDLSLWRGQHDSQVWYNTSAIISHHQLQEVSSSDHRCSPPRPRSRRATFLHWPWKRMLCICRVLSNSKYAEKQTGGNPKPPNV